jgi:hypothetical protein
MRLPKDIRKTRPEWHLSTLVQKVPEINSKSNPGQKAEMFAAARLVDEGTSNDDRPIPDSVLQEAVNLCLRDPSNISKLVRGCVTKLTNSFVMVRIKALGILLHIAQHGPPEVVKEVAANSQPIWACQNWRGEPHPTRGFEPYDVMRDAIQLLLNFGKEPSASKPRFAGSNTAPIPSSPPVPSRTGGSIMNPYPTQTPPDPPPQSAFPGYPSQTAPTYPVYSRSAQSGSGGLLRDTIDSVSSFFKKAFSRHGGFNEFPDALQQVPAAPATEYSPYGYTIANAPSQPVYNRDNMSGTSLVDQLDAPGVQRSSERSLQRQGKPKKPVVPLTPAKKLLKVTGGRAMATADELRAFHDSLTIESIAELAAGLTHEEWKIRVRAILGLELCGERYGLQAVAHVKSEVLSLTGAPQASLRTAATRFHGAIRLVSPGPPTEEKSAFSFIQDAVPDTGGPPEAEEIIVIAEPEPSVDSKEEDKPDEAEAPVEPEEEDKPVQEEEEGGHEDERS